MAKEIKSIAAGGKKIETIVSAPTQVKFAKYCKRLNTSQAQVLRDYIQSLTKKIR